MTKEPMDSLKKVKIMLLVEYLIFSALFITLGTLFLTDVIKTAAWKRYAFTYVTLIGGTWILFDFIWCLCSPTHRAKNSMVDKWILLPVGFCLLTFDIYAIVHGCAETLPYRWFIGSDLAYLGAAYLFQSIYHWYHPIPAVIQAALEDEEKKRSEEEEPGPDNQ